MPISARLNFRPSIFPQQQHMHAIPRHYDKFSPRAVYTLVTRTNQEERESRLSRPIKKFHFRLGQFSANQKIRLSFAELQK